MGKIIRKTVRFKSDIDKLNQSVMQRAEKETGKLSQEISNLRTEIQQEIINVNCKFHQMTERMNENIKLHMGEAKVEQINFGKEIETAAEPVIAKEF
jgi:hypothetical protein